MTEESKKINKRISVLQQRRGLMNIKTGAFIGGLIGVALILAVTFNSIGCGTAPAKKCYTKGQFKNEAVLKSGEPEGLVKKYYENGQLASEVIYKNGIAEGLSKMYSKSGQLEIEAVFKNGKFEGPTREYYANGQLKSERFYKDGKLEGFKDYDENGNLKQ
jgi:antitoxin component YwqK of YwqJK toxin-antitoxin module